MQHTTTTAGPDLDAVVRGSPEQVRQRLTRELFAVRSLWFPTLREMRAWDASTAALYVRWRGAGGFEVGPRLMNQQAARLSPVLRAAISEAEAGQCRLSGRIVMPTAARALLVVWSLVLLVWLGVLLAAIERGDRQLDVLVVWLLAALGTAVAVTVGWVAGGRALRSALPELVRVASDPDSGEDDWS